MDQRNLLSSQQYLKTDNNSRVLHPDDAEILPSFISCSSNPTAIQLEEVQQPNEHRGKCNWVLQEIKFVPYPQPDFRL